MDAGATGTTEQPTNRDSSPWTERVDSSQPEKNANEDAEWEALSDEQEPDADPIEKQETVSEATGDVYEAIRLINEERVKAGLSALESDSTMMEMAAVRAQEMSVDFSHTRLDGSHWWTIFQDYGMDPGGPGGENGGAGKDTADRQVSSWMKSTAGHKENILEKGITKIGVGYYYSKGSQYGHYWAMITA